MTRTGLVPNLTNREYHSGSEISSSKLVKFMTSPTPAHYKYHIDNPKEPSPAMKLGTAIHAAILEPVYFAEAYIMKPGDIDFRTSVGKAWKEANGTKNILNPDEWEIVQKIVRNIEKDQGITDALSGGFAEQSYFWTDTLTGLQCRCRPDYLKDNLIIDVKSTSAQGERELGMQAASSLYHVQAAFYLNGLKKITGQDFTFKHLVVETTGPCLVSVRNIPAEHLSNARQDIRIGMQKLKACMDADTWPGYETAEDFKYPTYTRSIYE